MADIGGAFFPLDYERGTLFKGKDANYKFYPVPLGPHLRYRMRAWNTVTVDWEIWTSVESPPSIVPPSGDPVTNVTLIGITEET